jgi:hypothetical protein
VHADMLTTIDMFSPEELTNVPFKGSGSVGQIMPHIADCEKHWLHRLVRQEIESGTRNDGCGTPAQMVCPIGLRNLLGLREAHHWVVEDRLKFGFWQ